MCSCSASSPSAPAKGKTPKILVYQGFRRFFVPVVKMKNPIKWHKSGLNYIKMVVKRKSKGGAKGGAKIC